MKHYRIIAILIPLIFSGCAASHSDKELVDSYYNDQQKTIESDVINSLIPTPLKSLLSTTLNHTSIQPSQYRIITL